MDELAPIVIFVYNRVKHTKQVINSLLNNSLSCKSELFLYSDNCDIGKQDERVLNVRKYLLEISGFKKIHIIERYKLWFSQQHHLWYY